MHNKKGVDGVCACWGGGGGMTKCNIHEVSKYNTIYMVWENDENQRFQNSGLNEDGKVVWLLITKVIMIR